MAERNALVITTLSIGVTAIFVSIVCSIIYLKKFRHAQQESKQSIKNNLSSIHY